MTILITPTKIKHRRARLPPRGGLVFPGRQNSDSPSPPPAQVNNAAVSFNDIGENSAEHAEAVIRTNFHGPKRLTEALLPLFRCSSSHSRILNVSSQLGLLSVGPPHHTQPCSCSSLIAQIDRYAYFCVISEGVRLFLQKVKDEGLRAMLKDEEGLSEAAIEGMVAAFLWDVKEGTWRQRGWPRVWTDYAVSKLALNAYSRLLARKLEGARISVNCFCPGFTRTTMTRGRGERTAEEAAHVAACLVLLPAAELPTGRFFKWCTPAVYSAL